MVRLTGFGGLEPRADGPIGEMATVALRLGEPTGKGRLQTSFHAICHVTYGAIDSGEVRRWAGAYRVYSAGPRRKTLLDLPLSRMRDER